MEDEVYEFVNEAKVVFKDERTVIVTYGGESREIKLSIWLGLYRVPQSHDVLPKKMILDLTNHFIGEDDKKEAIYIAENCVYGDMVTQQLGIRFAE
ncbi:MULTISPECIES: hypothetical protein [Halomonas]|uniref:hypothetical protein n=1 Tax=Halomonas TaxID=2745 RepID=UPI000A28BB7E|nr:MULTISPECIES: hypothetical protein [Halomonas]